MEKVNFADLNIRNQLKNQWKMGKMDICVVTYNRLPYLQKCINSLLASSHFVGKIIVHDDGSTDGSRKWLEMMYKRGRIDFTIFNDRLGSAESINEAVKHSNSEIVVIVNDDMYFHRYWDYAVMNTFINAQKCGIVSFYDYARLGADDLDNKNDKSCDFFQIPRTGMACTAIRREIFNIVKGFSLTGKHKMGYYASTFCEKVINMKHKYTNWVHYATYPNYATHIDHPQNKLCDRDILQGYQDYREKNKKGRANPDYYSDYDFGKK